MMEPKFKRAAFLLLFCVSFSAGLQAAYENEFSQEGDYAQAEAIAQDYQKDIERRALEERFQFLSKSLGAMPQPPEMRNKTISFGENEKSSATS